MSGELTLQVNTNGAWKNIGKFNPERRDGVVNAARILGDILGAGTAWSLLHPDGRREVLFNSLTEIYRREDTF